MPPLPSPPLPPPSLPSVYLETAAAAPVNVCRPRKVSIPATLRQLEIQAQNFGTARVGPEQTPLKIFVRRRLLWSLICHAYALSLPHQTDELLGQVYVLERIG